MRLIFLAIVIMVVADAAFARSAFDTVYIYENRELSEDGSPAVMRVNQWVSGSSAKTTIKVSVRNCTPLKMRDFKLKFVRRGPRNHLKVKTAAPQNLNCANPDVQVLNLYTSAMKPIDLADIKVNGKKLILRVYSNRSSIGSGER